MTNDLLKPGFPAPREGMLLTHMLVVRDQAKSKAFYADLFDAEVVNEDTPVMLRIANGWIMLNEGGGPTDDKPETHLVAPDDISRLTGFINVRVADIQALYREWTAKGAEFLTEPKDHGEEIRCYLKDPDGHLIEIGQTTGGLKD